VVWLLRRQDGSVYDRLPQYTFSADLQSDADKLFRGSSPSKDGTELTNDLMPDGVPMQMAPERREELAGPRSRELLKLVQAVAEPEMRDADQ